MPERPAPDQDTPVTDTPFTIAEAETTLFGPAPPLVVR